MQIKFFLPFKSESLPKMGMKMPREIENAAKIMPTQTAVAPKFSAYRGKSGAIIPTPSIEEKIEMTRIAKTLFVILQLTKHNSYLRQNKNKCQTKSSYQQVA